MAEFGRVDASLDDGLHSTSASIVGGYSEDDFVDDVVHDHVLGCAPNGYAHAGSDSDLRTIQGPSGDSFDQLNTPGEAAGAGLAGEVKEVHSARRNKDEVSVPEVAEEYSADSSEGADAPGEMTRLGLETSKDVTEAGRGEPQDVGDINCSDDDETTRQIRHDENAGSLKVLDPDKNVHVQAHEARPHPAGQDERFPVGGAHGSAKNDDDEARGEQTKARYHADADADDHHNSSWAGENLLSPDVISHQTVVDIEQTVKATMSHPNDEANLRKSSLSIREGIAGMRDKLKKALMYSIAPGHLSQKNVQKMATSPYCGRPDSIVKRRGPSFPCKPQTPRTMPQIPGKGLGHLIRSGALTPRGTHFLSGENLDRTGTTVCPRIPYGLDRKRGALFGGRKLRPATAQAPKPSQWVKDKARPSSCRHMSRQTKVLWHSTSSIPRPHPPSSAKSLDSSCTSVSSNHLYMKSNPYEIVSLAMTDTRNKHNSLHVWPYGNTWSSGEARYSGYCTPELPARCYRHGIHAPIRKSRCTIASRCGIEYLEQLYASSLHVETPEICSDDGSSADIISHRGDVTLQGYLQNADMLEERVWASEKMGRALMNKMHQDRFAFSQVNAVEELALDNNALRSSLHRVDRMLYWSGILSWDQ